MSQNLTIDSSEFIELGRRPPIAVYLKNIWAVRDFVWGQARLQALTAGRNTNLGRAWLVLDPFIRIGFYFVIFGLIVRTDRGVENFLAFLAVGIILFRPLQSALAQGGSALNQNGALIRTLNVPRATVFFSMGIRNFLNGLPDLVALLIFVVVIPPHVTPNLLWPSILILLVLRAIFTTGLALFSARLTFEIPDLLHVWPILGRFWFYGSGIIFSISNYVDNPIALLILQLNPAHPMLEIGRSIVISGDISTVANWLQFAGWSGLALLVGLVLFWRAEVRYGRGKQG